jgi:glycosyltransferase involved in cell wall biosynthesis
LLVDPQDAHAIGDAMKKLITDEGVRKDLQAKGVARAHTFTWQRTAQRTLEIMNRAGGLS